VTELQTARVDVMPRPGKPLDTKTIEVLALAAFRGVFGKGVRVPLKIPGVIDMDLAIRDSNVVVNMNQVQLDVPELVLWRFTFAYQGKAVIEYGRGLKNGMKIHFGQLFALLLTMWRTRSDKIKARAKSEKAVHREMISVALTDPKPENPRDWPV
jgi:hypothetical protein